MEGLSVRSGPAESRTARLESCPSASPREEEAKCAVAELGGDRAAEYRHMGSSTRTAAKSTITGNRVRDTATQIDGVSTLLGQRTGSFRV